MVVRWKNGKIGQKPWVMWVINVDDSTVVYGGWGGGGQWEVVVEN
jgi:hypothetical protein